MYRPRPENGVDFVGYRQENIISTNVCGGWAESHLKKLQIAQNKWLELVRNKPFYYNTRKIHDEAKANLVKETIRMHIDKFTGCAFSNNPYISSLFR